LKIEFQKKIERGIDRRFFVKLWKNKSTVLPWSRNVAKNINRRNGNGEWRKRVADVRFYLQRLGRRNEYSMRMEKDIIFLPTGVYGGEFDNSSEKHV
jgi:hypothetical protein